jgi:hypothetical protein
VVAFSVPDVVDGSAMGCGGLDHGGAAITDDWPTGPI